MGGGLLTGERGVRVSVHGGPAALGNAALGAGAGTAELCVSSGVARGSARPPLCPGSGGSWGKGWPGGRAGRVSEGPAGDLTLQLGGQDRRQPRALLPQAGPHQGGRAGGLGGRLRHGAGGGCCHGPRPPREQAAEGGRRGNSRAALAIPPGGPAPGPRPQGSPGAVISRGGHWGPGCGQEPGICRHLPGSAGSEWVTATSARGGGRGATPAGPRPARPGPGSPRRLVTL